MSVTDPLQATPTAEEFESLHERITAMETRLLRLQADTSEIVEWVRGGKVASKMAARFFSSMGLFMLWIAKLIGAIAMLYGAAMAIKNGKLPAINFFE